MTTPRDRFAVPWWVVGLALAAPATARGASKDMSGQMERSRRDLVTSSVAAPASAESASAAAADLERAIQRLQAIRVAPKARPPAPTPDAVAEAAAPLLAALPAPAAPAAETVEPAPAGPVLSDAMMEALKRLPPEKVADPLGLADALYQAGRLPEADLFYGRILDGPASGDAESRAWALFQRANCRRPTDAKAAVDLYRRVVQEQPQSRWAPLAAVQQRLLEWYETLRPQSAVTEDLAQSAPKGEGS